VTPRLTNREYFAGLAMQAMARFYDIGHKHIYEDLAVDAVKAADALIEELNKEKS